MRAQFELTQNISIPVGNLIYLIVSAKISYWSTMTLMTVMTLSTKVYTQWPFFIQNFNVKFQIFHALRAYFKIFSIFNWKRQFLLKIWQDLPQMPPLFLESSHQLTHTHQWPLFFYEILHKIPLVFILQ